MDRTSDFGSDSEGSNPSAVTNRPYFRGFFVCLPPVLPPEIILISIESKIVSKYR